MHEPTYLVPRHLLFAVQAHGDNVRTLARRLTDAIRDGMPVEPLAELRKQHSGAALAYHCAILLAAAEGATSAELIGYGVTRDLAAELDRRATQ